MSEDDERAACYRLDAPEAADLARDIADRLEDLDRVDAIGVLAYAAGCILSITHRGAREHLAAYLGQAALDAGNGLAQIESEETEQ